MQPEPSGVYMTEHIAYDRPVLARADQWTVVANRSSACVHSSLSWTENESNFVHFSLEIWHLVASDLLFFSENQLTTVCQIWGLSTIWRGLSPAAPVWRRHCDGAFGPRVTRLACRCWIVCGRPGYSNLPRRWLIYHISAASTRAPAGTWSVVHNWLK